MVRFRFISGKPPPLPIPRVYSDFWVLPNSSFCNLYVMSSHHIQIFHPSSEKDGTRRCQVTPIWRGTRVLPRALWRTPYWWSKPRPFTGGGTVDLCWGLEKASRNLIYKKKRTPIKTTLHLSVTTTNKIFGTPLWNGFLFILGLLSPWLSFPVRVSVQTPRSRSSRIYVDIGRQGLLHTII